jgi:hypothetical protein
LEYDQLGAVTLLAWVTLEPISSNLLTIEVWDLADFDEFADLSSHPKPPGTCIDKDNWAVCLLEPLYNFTNDMIRHILQRGRLPLD